MSVSLLPACVGLTVLATTTFPARGAGQSPSELVLHVEPAALGVHYSLAVGGDWRVGPQLVLGPFHGVSLHRESSGELKEWASAYLSVRYPVGRRAVLAVAPVGASLVLGGDFAAVYPTGQIGGDYRVGRVLIGSDLRVIRIAGPNGTGDYWIQWIPLRIGIVFGGQRPE